MGISSVPRRKGDAVDVDDFSDFKQLVLKIVANTPQKITIYVDMADVQRSWKNVSPPFSDT